MFNSNRYITRGISDEVPVEIVLFLWYLIDELKVTSQGKMDYLQVFELKIQDHPYIVENQIVIHRTEEPEYKRGHALLVDEPIATKIYVIDSMDYCTMLLAREY